MAFEPSPETLKYIEEVIPRYPKKRSAIMMILHAIQKEAGYLSLEAQEWVAARLELTPIQVREVVTFSAAGLGLGVGLGAGRGAGWVSRCSRAARR